MLIGNDPSSDYINASFVKGYDGADVQYIATQAPMDTTVDDFWRMVWEHKVEIVTMATNFEERGFEKCERFVLIRNIKIKSTLSMLHNS